MAGRGISARKSGAGGERDDRRANARAAALAVGYPGNHARGIFGRFGAGAQFGGGQLARVRQVELGRSAAQQQFFGRQTRILVLGRGAGHRDCARRQFAQRGIAQVGRTDAGGTPADEHPQRGMFALGTLDVFQLAQTDLHALRGSGGEQCVGGMGTGGTGALDQRLAARLRLFGRQHEGRPQT